MLYIKNSEHPLTNAIDIDVMLTRMVQARGLAGVFASGKGRRGEKEQEKWRRANMGGSERERETTPPLCPGHCRG